ncbi:cullin-2-like [Phymastichus coffea]|uniref:cullin-2-like n=1 Tax=Phymastichus coffea TaxID=108790 RepID=UPI00273CE4E9|nr:cullin-2-like [Phymastichus coffea]
MSLKPKVVDFGQTWNILQETVKGVITLADVPRATWNDRFSDVYSLCVAYPEPLADRLYIETEKFLDNHVNQLLIQVQSHGEIGLLQSYHRAWTQYSQGINYLHQLYLYLNQQHIKKQKLTEAEIIYGSPSTIPDCQEQKEIGELGLYLWENKMIASLKDLLVTLLLEGIHADRLGKAQPATSDVICGVIESFVRVEEYKMKGQLKLYQDIFEGPFLKQSGEFYAREASELLQQSNVTRYMERVTWRLSQEELRAHKFLHITSVPKVRQCCEEKMVAAHVAWLHTEVDAMVEHERRKDLSLIYPLLRPLPSGLAHLVRKLTQHVTNEGLQAIGSLHGDNVHTQFVENMLEVHAKYSNLIKDLFKGDQVFVGALDKACSAVVNHRMSPRQLARAPELIGNVFLVHSDNAPIFLLDLWSGQCEKTVNEALPNDKSVVLKTIQEGTTGQIQPLDVYGFRLWKNFIRKLSDLTLLMDYDLNLHERNNIIKIQSLSHNKFSLPRFQNVFQYTWYKTGEQDESEDLSSKKKRGQNLRFNFEISPEEWSKIEPVKGMYKNGREIQCLQAGWTDSYCTICKADLKIYCEERPIDGKPIVFQVETKNSHGIPPSNKRRLAGPQRIAIKKELECKKPKRQSRK